MLALAKRIINSFEETVIALLLVSTTLMVFIDVVMRFGFSAGFLWSQELTLHMSAWFVLFGVSYGLKTGAHIGVDAFVNLFAPPVQRMLTALAVVLSLVYCGLFIYGGWVYLAKMKMIGIDLEDLPIPTWLAHGMLVVGMVFLSIRLLELLWAVAFRGVTNFSRSDEGKESMQLAERMAAEKEADR